MIEIDRRGMADAIETLNAMPGQVARAARTSVGVTATATRRRIVVLAMAATGLKRSLLNSRTPLKRTSKKGEWSARLKPSQRGIPVPWYRWKHEPTGRNPTRHRILVGWPGGDKIAAGFVNPFGQYRAPLTTRRNGYDLAIALGPSAAALFSTLFSEPDLTKTLDELEKEFMTRLQTEIR